MKTCLKLYANSSLISILVVCCLDSIIPIYAIFKISSIQLAFVAGLSHTWPQNPKDRFSRGVAQLYSEMR